MVDHAHGNSIDAWLTTVIKVLTDAGLTMVMEEAMRHRYPWSW